MSVKPLRTINVSDRTLNQIQGNVSDWAASVSDALSDKILGGSIVDVSFGKADEDLTVAHGLGKDVTGYEVVRRDKAATVYDSPTSSTQPSLTFLLRCNVAGTKASIRFF